MARLLPQRPQNRHLPSLAAGPLQGRCDGLGRARRGGSATCIEGGIRGGGRVRDGDRGARADPLRHAKSMATGYHWRPSGSSQQARVVLGCVEVAEHPRIVDRHVAHGALAARDRMTARAPCAGSAASSSASTSRRHTTGWPCRSPETGRIAAQPGLSSAAWTTARTVELAHARARPPASPAPSRRGLRERPAQPVQQRGELSLGMSGVVQHRRRRCPRGPPRSASWCSPVTTASGPTPRIA